MALQQKDLETLIRNWLLFGAMASVLIFPGCSRRFYRNQADQEMKQILTSKDVFPTWKIENYHVLPDPRSRFASVGNQDRPPAPPDDPATMAMSPNPQTPGQAGIAHMEGAGYLDILAQFDQENRAKKVKAFEPPIKLASFQMEDTGDYKDPLEQDKGPFDSMGLSYKGDPAGRYTKPFLVNLEQTADIALLNSREFQSRREDLYAAALPVSVQRFAFAAQFYATEAAIREQAGSKTPVGSDTNLQQNWAMNTNTGFTKTFSTGALLLFRMANQAVVEMGRTEGTKVIAPSTMTLDLFQPLFQGGGRAVTLEPLTIAERSLLYELRSYARFRKEFYANIIAGGTTGNLRLSPTQASGVRSTGVFGAGLADSGAIQVAPGASSGATLVASSATAQREGFYAAVLKAGQLRIERENLRDVSVNLDRYREIQAVGDMDELQVSRILQQQLSFKSSVLTRELTLRDALDRFKFQLGIPIDLPLELDSSPLQPQIGQLNRYSNLVEEFKNVRGEARKLGKPELSDTVRQGLRKILVESEFVRDTSFRQRLPVRWKEWADLPLDKLLEKRQLIKVERQKLLETKEFKTKRQQPLTLQEKDRISEMDFEFFLSRFELNLRTFEKKPWILMGKIDIQAFINFFEDLIDDFLLVLVEPRNEKLRQIRKLWPGIPNICLEGVNLLEGDLDEALFIAGRHALTNRLDLMNGRAQLMDAWRQIAIAANALQGVFNVEYSMKGFTPFTTSQPVNFSGSALSHRLILTGELPLVRIQERNGYRATLINWQRQRRALMQFEDTVLFDIRTEIRQLRTLSRNYEIQKLAVEIAYVVLDQAEEKAYEPAQPGAQNQANSSSAQTTLTQQLLQAQQDKLRAQQSLFDFWTNILTFRVFLYRDLELMPLDAKGVWIDDIATTQCGGFQPAEAPGQLKLTPDSAPGSPGIGILLPPRKLLPRRLPSPATDPNP